MSEEFEKYKIRVGLIKFILGTVVLGVLTAFINFQLQNREIDLKQKEIELKDKEIALRDKDIEQQEIVQLGNYIDHAIQENVAIRRRFAQYFSTVTSSEAIRERWQEYFKLVDGEYKQLTAHIELLEAEKEQLTKSNSSEKELNILRAQLDVALSELEVQRTNAVVETVDAPENTVTEKTTNPTQPQPSTSTPTPTPAPATKKMTTAWSSWVDVGGGVGNPCPSGYSRGKELGQSYRSVGFPPRAQAKHKFECKEQ